MERDITIEEEINLMFKEFQNLAERDPEKFDERVEEIYRECSEYGNLASLDSTIVADDNNYLLMRSMEKRMLTFVAEAVRTGDEELIDSIKVRANTFYRSIKSRFNDLINEYDLDI